MASLFNRLKIWKSFEIIKTADLNAEFDNIQAAGRHPLFAVGQMLLK